MYGRATFTTEQAKELGWKHAWKVSGAEGIRDMFFRTREQARSNCLYGDRVTKVML